MIRSFERLTSPPSSCLVSHSCRHFALYSSPRKSRKLFSPSCYFLPSSVTLFQKYQVFSSKIGVIKHHRSMTLKSSPGPTDLINGSAACSSGSSRNPSQYEMRDKAYMICREFLSGSWKKISSSDMVFKSVT